MSNPITLVHVLLADSSRALLLLLVAAISDSVVTSFISFFPFLFFFFYQRHPYETYVKILFALTTFPVQFFFPSESPSFHFILVKTYRSVTPLTHCIVFFKFSPRPHFKPSVLSVSSRGYVSRSTYNKKFTNLFLIIRPLLLQNNFFVLLEASLAISLIF